MVRIRADVISVAIGDRGNIAQPNLLQKLSAIGYFERIIFAYPKRYIGVETIAIIHKFRITPKRPS